jgi:endonuclease/exonuclease/phosphatase family metal-dependent hydrolase
VALAAIMVPLAIRGPGEVALPVPQGADSAANQPAPTISVMSLNLAHGRGEGFHQTFQKRTTIEANLDRVAEVLRRERPDFVGFQEADGPSVWSGNFNHVEYLAQAAGYPSHFRGEHVRGLGLSYGTAIVSRLPARDAVSFTFAANPPTPSKGFVVARFSWPGRPGFDFDLASVHLDFLRASVRRKQIDQLAGELDKRGKPLVVLGDFNCGWTDQGSPVRALAERLRLKAYRPDDRNLGTYPSAGRRLDWILISPPLEFVEYKVLRDAVSDHRAVVAVLRLGEGSPP